MSTPLRFDDSRLQRMEQATLWLQRMREAGDDERVVDAWLDWCQRDPQNQQAFDEITAVWELSGRLVDAPRATTAVAAAHRPRRRALLAAVAGLGLAMLAGAFWMLRPQPAVLASEFTSPIGVNSVHTLADGSVLELGGGTRVTVSIGARERRVQLHDGELYVTVHHETGRPFLVAANGLEVIATGTAFNVRHTSERTTVTVAEGSVKVLHEGRPVGLQDSRLLAGKQLVYLRASHGMTLRTVDPSAAIAWRSGVLPFEGEPLSEVVAAINRYSARQIVIEDAQVRSFAFTGTAHADDIRTWLRRVTQIFPVAVVDLPDGRQQIRLRSARSD